MNPPNVPTCESLDQVRAGIDRIDRAIVACLAERGAYVKQAAGFKKSSDDVRAPQRVEQVVGKAVALAQELGADPVVTERTYRAMISGFIEAELAEHSALRGAPVPLSADGRETRAQPLRPWWAYALAMVAFVACLWIGWRDFDPSISQDAVRETIRLGIRGVFQLAVQFVVPVALLLFIGHGLFAAVQARKSLRARI